jgi:hypothetical protein
MRLANIVEIITSLLSRSDYFREMDECACNQRGLVRTVSRQREMIIALHTSGTIVRHPRKEEGPCRLNAGPIACVEDRSSVRIIVILITRHTLQSTGICMEVDLIAQAYGNTNDGWQVDPQWPWVRAVHSNGLSYRYSQIFVDGCYSLDVFGCVESRWIILRRAAHFVWV